jgi:hypothetical protein
VDVLTRTLAALAPVPIVAVPTHAALARPVLTVAVPTHAALARPVLTAADLTRVALARPVLIVADLTHVALARPVLTAADLIRVALARQVLIAADLIRAALAPVLIVGAPTHAVVDLELIVAGPIRAAMSPVPNALVPTHAGEFPMRTLAALTRALLVPVPIVAAPTHAVPDPQVSAKAVFLAAANPTLRGLRLSPDDLGLAESVQTPTRAMPTRVPTLAAPSRAVPARAPTVAAPTRVAPAQVLTVAAPTRAPPDPVVPTGVDLTIGAPPRAQHVLDPIHAAAILVLVDLIPGHVVATAARTAMRPTFIASAPRLTSKNPLRPWRSSIPKVTNLTLTPRPTTPMPRGLPPGLLRILEVASRMTTSRIPISRILTPTPTKTKPTLNWRAPQLLTTKLALNSQAPGRLRVLILTRQPLAA